MEKDECERSGLRKCLNMGHTTGHALELFYKRRSHGEYVLIGMLLESYIAEKFDICAHDYAEELRALIGKVLKRVPRFENIADAAGVALYDKKNQGENEVSLIVPAKRGEFAELRLTDEDYVGYIEEIAGGLA